jgi:hypothetical protein
MAGSVHHQSPGIDRIVERQMRNWELAQTRRGVVPLSGDRQVADFIAISRAVGLPGREVATLLSLKLGWPLFDREILQAMAGNDDCRRQLYESMDERDLNWLESLIEGMSGGRGVLDDYFNRLSETILSLAGKGHAIFLGRAADLILPQQVGLRVRIQAGRDFCVTSYAKSKQVSLERAARIIEEIEHERARFIRHHFGKEVNDPARCDIFLNMERFTVQQAADLILSALRVKGTIS